MRVFNLNIAFAVSNAFINKQFRIIQIKVNCDLPMECSNIILFFKINFVRSITVYTPLCTPIFVATVADNLHQIFAFLGDLQYAANILFIKNK